MASGHAGGNPRFEWWFGRLWVDPVNKDHLFKADVSLRVSTHGGATWATRRTRTPTSTAWPGTRTSPNRVYLGNDGGMYRSDNNGTAPGSMPRTSRGTRSYHVAVSQTRPNRIAIGLQDNGSNRDAGRTPTTRSPTRSLPTGARTAAATATTS